MGDIKVLEALDAGSDVLLVKGERDGEPIQAQGWVSAMANHFPPDAFCPGDGSHVLGKTAKSGKVVCSDLHRDDRDAREMTAKEKRAYCLSLLAEQNPPPPKPISLG
jgi:hypothetical protein